MKILFIAPYLPSPPRFGGQRRLDGLMRGLARDHEVSVLAFNTTDPYTELSVEATRVYCRQVSTLADLDVQHVHSKRLLQGRSLLSLHSFEYLLAERRRDFQARLEQMLAAEQYDVVQTEFAQMAVYRVPRGGSRRPLLVLDEHNIEYDLQRRTADAQAGVTRHLYNAVNWRKLHLEERAAWKRSDGVVVTSARDQRLISENRVRVPSAVAPNGVDVDAFQPSSAPVEDSSLLFFGAINYYPNQDGVLYFVDEVMPRVLARRPQAKLSILGPGARKPVLDRQGPSVKILGFVDDVNQYLDRAAVVVVPLRIGGGTRLKIVEAMAKGKAIVSTRIGAEGLDVVDGEHLLLADEPAEFAEQVERVLADPALSARLGRAARKLSEERYSWRAVVGGLERFYDRLRADRGI